MTIANKYRDESRPILGDYKNERIYGSTSPNTPQINRRHRNDNFTYPKAVYFVLASKFFEAFSANGIRTILALYLRDSLNFSQELSTTVLHSFNFFGQFCPIVGAILADSYFGNVRTIFWIFFVYACGWIGMISLTFPIGGIPVLPLVTSALVLIAIGNGSIRACITSLGGSQFRVPEQQIDLDKYFHHYYFVYYMGILLSKIVPPQIRAQTQCFGRAECYTIVFGTLGILLLAAWIIFLLGLCFYKNDEPARENLIGKVFGCVFYGLVEKCRRRPETEVDTNSNWLSGAKRYYPESFVNDVSSFLKVILIFCPLPIYWSLLTQQDSTWTFQATQLNTVIFGFRIQPDQAKAIGPVFLLILIPISRSLKKIGCTLEPLKSVALGGICAALSFLSAGLLQLWIERFAMTGQKLTILWQMPQFFLIMMGEVLLAIPGLQFAFNEAPKSMKSVITAAWFINNAMGNLFVILITKANLMQQQSTEFFIYALLMIIGISCFYKIASNYSYNHKSVDHRENL